MKVHYFDGYGKGDMLRIALRQAGQEFEDVRYTQDTWKDAKASGKFEFGQIPAVELPNGQVYAQSNSILRYIGRKFGFYSEDPYTAWRMDSTLDSVSDIQNAFYKCAFEQDAEKKKAALENFFGNVFPGWAGAMEKRIVANTSRQFFVGDKVSIADFALAGWMYSTPYNESSAAYAPF